MAALGELDPFARKKRGFNPPLAGWLEGDLAPRLPGLGARLARLSQGLLRGPRIDAFVAAWRGGTRASPSRCCRLVLLDESLAQLAALAAAA